VLHLVLEFGELGDDLLALRLLLTGIARTHASVGIINRLSLVTWNYQSMFSRFG
jgi:hypothetical protein